MATLEIRRLNRADLERMPDDRNRSYDTDPREKRDLCAGNHTIVAFASPVDSRFTRHETSHSGC